MEFDTKTGFLLFQGIKNDTSETIEILEDIRDGIKDSGKNSERVIQVLNKGTKPQQRREATLTADLTDSTLDKLAKRNKLIAEKSEPKKSKPKIAADENPKYKKDKTGRYRDEKGKFLSAKDLEKLGLKNDDKPKTAKEQVQSDKKAESGDGTKLDIDASGLLNVADTMGEAYSESAKEIYGLFSGIGTILTAPMKMIKNVKGWFGKKEKEPQVEAIDAAKDDIVKALGGKEAPTKPTSSGTPTKPVSEQKQRVLDNIQKSKEARKSSRFKKGAKPSETEVKKVSPVKKTTKTAKAIDTSKCECDDTKKVAPAKKQIKDEAQKPVSVKPTPTETAPVSKGEKSRQKRASKKTARSNKKRNKLLASGNKSSGLLMGALRFLAKPLMMLLPALSFLPKLLGTTIKNMLPSWLGGSDKKVDTKKQTKKTIKDVKKSTPKPKAKPKAKPSTIGKMFKGAKNVGKVVKGAGIVSAVMGAIDLANIWTDKETKTKGKDGKLDKTAETVGGMGGAMGGAVLGASIGSVIPVVGTAIGGLIGGALGYFGGSFLGDKAGDVLFEEKKAKEVKKGDKKSLANNIKKETSKGAKKEAKTSNKPKAKKTPPSKKTKPKVSTPRAKPKEAPKKAPKKKQNKSHQVEYEGKTITVSDEQVEMLVDLQKQGRGMEVLSLMAALARSQQKKPKVAKVKSLTPKTPVAKTISPMSKIPQAEKQVAKESEVAKENERLKKEVSSRPVNTPPAQTIVNTDNSDVVRAIKQLGVKLDKSNIDNKAVNKNIISHTPRRDSVNDNM